jgi:uncharacterized damage-inducible protein DinB
MKATTADHDRALCRAQRGSIGIEDLMSTDQALPATIDDLVSQMEQSRAAFAAVIDGLSTAQLAAPLTAGGWSAADHMAHIAAWMEGILAALDGTSRWTVMGTDGPPGQAGFDTLNERLRVLHAAKTPAEVQAWLDATHVRTLARLRGMTIAELRRPYRHYQPGEARDDAEEPFLNWVVGDTVAHYDEHSGWIGEALRERG